MDVCLLCDCCLLLSRGLCVAPISRPEESYRVWPVQWVWSRSPVRGGHDPESGQSVTGKESVRRNCFVLWQWYWEKTFVKHCSSWKCLPRRTWAAAQTAYITATWHLYVPNLLSFRASYRGWTHGSDNVKCPDCLRWSGTFHRIRSQLGMNADRSCASHHHFCPCRRT